jgi:hypothetical protein
MKITPQLPANRSDKSVQKKYADIQLQETPGLSSPRGSKRGCLCKDNTYSRKCCNGALRAQGIGNIN